MGGTMQTADAQDSRNVFINRSRLPDDTLSLLEQQFRTKVPDGRYWYDQLSGAWGKEGGPTLGFTLPGMPIGGPLTPDISGGTTAVYINGRRLHVVDLAGLQQLTGPIMPGRYWVDAQWNAGQEGGPALVNLRMLAAQQRGMYRQGSGTGENYGGGAGAYYNSNTGIGFVSDGQGGGGVW
jgi:hypothetical protein